MTISSRLPNKACLSTMELLIPLVYLPGSRLIILWWTILRAFLFESSVSLATSLFCAQKNLQRRDAPSMPG